MLLKNVREWRKDPQFPTARCSNRTLNYNDKINHVTLKSTSVHFL